MSPLSPQQHFEARWSPDRPQPIARSFPWPDDLFALFLRLRARGAVLLESLGGPPAVARYSILGQVHRQVPLPPQAPRHPGDEVATALEQALSALPGPTALPLEAPAPPLPFVGGWATCLSYDLGRALENIPERHVSTEMPAAILLEVPSALVCDHHRREAWLVACVEPGPDASGDWSRTCELLLTLEQLICAPPPAPCPPFELAAPLSGEFSKAGYLEAIQEALEHIRAGDIFQVNLSQRFRAPCSGDGAELYARLRRASPAPFAAYLETDTVAVLSSSPERFLWTDGQRVETRPIKGTYRRGRDTIEDQAQACLLRQDPKEQAEHVMIVDLSRNDLGRLAAPDSVAVHGLLRVETYPQLLHLVSTVSARLERPPNLWELLRATFPGASITGAPKVRAMELIETLEASRRGIYTGAIGYISRSGHIDLNIAIRSLVIHRGELHMQVGGGIVARSIPLSEYEETLLKARGMCMALGLAPESLEPQDSSASRLAKESTFVSASSLGPNPPAPFPKGKWAQNSLSFSPLPFREGG